MNPSQKNQLSLILGIALASLYITPALSAGPNSEPLPAKPIPSTVSAETGAPSKPQLPTGAKSTTKAELDAIRTQNALDAERQKGTRGGASPQGAVPNVPSLGGAEAIPVIGNRNQSSGSGNTALARVTMVAGPVGQLLATVQTSDGMVVARVGDRIPGVGTVKSISVNQVVVEDGRRSTAIPFAAEPTSNLIQGPGSK